MRTPRRDERITLKREKDNQYSLFGSRDRYIADNDEDYSFYFTSVNLRSNGDIEGRYLGDDYSRLLDEYCKEIYYNTDDNRWCYVDSNKEVKTVRMAVFENKKGIIVVIGD